MNSLSRWVAIAAVLLVGGSVAIASRNSSGTYSLPAGNPVVSGSTITSTWANSTLTDLATGVTDSLDRYGRGAMLAPLKATDGSETAPSLTFSGQTTTGFYRAGSGDVRVTAAGADVVQWNSTGETVTGDLSVSGDTDVTGDVTATALTASNGIVIARSTANGTAITGTGDGTGAGVNGQGGDSGGTGVVGTGHGAAAIGGSFSGADGGTGVVGTVAGTGAVGTGVYGLGAGTGVGVKAEAGTDATSTARSVALDVVNGDIDLDGVTAPSSTTSIKNRVTPSNIIKAWGHITCSSSGCTISRGFNLTSVSVSGGSALVVLAADISSGAVTTSFGGGGGASTVQAAISSSGVTVGFFDGTTKIDVASLSSLATFDFIATGVQ